MKGEEARVKGEEARGKGRRETGENGRVEKGEKLYPWNLVRLLLALLNSENQPHVITLLLRFLGLSLLSK